VVKFTRQTGYNNLFNLPGLLARFVGAFFVVSAMECEVISISSDDADDNSDDDGVQVPDTIVEYKQFCLDTVKSSQVFIPRVTYPRQHPLIKKSLSVSSVLFYLNNSVIV